LNAAAVKPVRSLSAGRNPILEPALGIAALPTTQHNTLDEILTESIKREEAGVELYRNFSR